MPVHPQISGKVVKKSPRYIILFFFTLSKIFVYPQFKVSCITDNFSVLIIVITEEWISISAEILPVFRAFPVQGPNITSRAVAREVMLGPKDRKCPKNGQNRGGNGYSSEGMSMISKLKLSVIHIILCYSRDFALPKTWFLSSCLTTKSLYIRFIF